MTKQEAIANHRKMWRWIAEHTRKKKRIVNKVEYFIEFELEPVMSWCYCCEYARNKITGHTNCPVCSFCPIQWNGKGDFRCVNTDSEYKKWLHAETWQEAVHWAEIIAELPERKV